MKQILLAAICITVLAPATSAAQEKSKEKAEREKQDKKIDEAIEKGLAYLHREQYRNKRDPGRYGAWVDRSGPNPAITGLCVMAFLSAGHVPDEGPYSKTVKDGIEAVLRFQHANGVIANAGGHEMYHHGICTLMLAEVVGMTQDQVLAKKIRTALKDAVSIILKAQRTEGGRYHGGWRYHVRHVQGSDMSVTGWQILALRAAKNVGCDVPPKAIEMAIDYVKRSQRRDGGFGYTPGGGTTLPCTGTGVLALELCGKEYHHSRWTLDGGAYLMRRLPRWKDTSHFFYSIYYRSQAHFQLGAPDPTQKDKGGPDYSNYWEAFRAQLHPMMLSNQSSDGSWRGGYYGYSYSSAMCILALTVEYRFLPIYQRGNEPIDR